MQDQETPQQAEAPPPQQDQQAPPPPTGQKKDTNIALLSHLLGILTGFLGPLIIWLIKKDDFKFVDDQGKEALNFQISVAMYALICIPLFFIFIGIFLFVALGIFNLVMIVIASIESNKGNAYRYPLCIRLVK